MSWAEHCILALAVLALGLVLFAIPAAVGYWLLPEHDAFDALERALQHPIESTSDLCPLADPVISHGPTLAHAVRAVCAVRHVGKTGSLSS
jgi:hypothetical protein